MKRESLANLPGQNIDRSARVLRDEIREGEQSHTEAAYRTESGDVDRELLDTELYAVASLVIESMWTRLASRPELLRISAPNEKELGDLSLQEFTQTFLNHLNVQRDAYVQEARVRAQESASTPDDFLLIRYWSAVEERDGQRGMPSMADHVVFLQRMTDVVPKVFERDLGHLPDNDQMSSALRHSSIQRLIYECMTNHRVYSDGLLAKLEGEKRGDLNDVARSFNPDYFEVRAVDGVPSVQLKSEIIETHRKVCERFAQTRTEEGTVPLRTLQCPVLYTGLFNEMHEWVSGQFVEYLKSQSS